jgi:hypothetical protein
MADIGKPNQVIADIVARNVSGQESVPQSLDQMGVEFVEVMLIGLYGSRGGVFLGLEVLYEPSNDLSHGNPPLL